MDPKAFTDLCMQVAAIHERVNNSIAVAQEDRAEIKADIRSVKSKVETLETTVQSGLDQIRGAGHVAKFIWIAGGFMVSTGIWASGLLHKLFPVLPR